ncbi:MAG TPA: hypothetical protein PKN63_02595, partial [Chitinophagales bacterium]|nr:hypothetical protein [Chitinophagales bacterium]
MKRNQSKICIVLILFSISVFFSACKKDKKQETIDVYVAVDEFNGTFNIAKLWKNGIIQDLNDGTKSASASSIFVQGSDVYLVGFEENSLGTNVAKLWKNGVAQNLSDGAFDNFANSIYVANNKTYIAGYQDNGIKRVAKIWVNGVATNLTNGLNHAYAGSVFVSGDDVYV